ncbi:MAG: hypothetical protein LAQ30_21165 [Acidobacteriia bacterium]|nr:hypothetical protein [Terriglobia bacterium]
MVHLRPIRSRAGLLFFVLLAATASAQITLPRRKSASKDSETTMPLPNFRGRLKVMDDKSITVKLDDARELDFKRSGKTRFFKNGQEIKTPDFKPGDQLSVESSVDPEGFYTAVNVYWEKAAATADAEDKSAGDVDAWKDVKPDAPPTPAVEIKPPPAKPDPDDPGPPQLRRGKPADVARERSTPVPDEPSAPQVAAARLPAELPRPAAPPPRRPANTDEDLPFGVRPQDPLIRKTADTALDFTETLPNYVCTEMIARYQSDRNPPNWQALDVVGAEVVYENGKEDYRKVTVNGKAVNKKIEDTGGAWSTGEFGTVLINLFNPATAAEFHYRKDSRINGINTKEYAYSVAQPNSHWTVQTGSQSYRPAFSGAVWIDPTTNRVLRIEMEGKGFPGDFPLDHVESATDYDYVRLGGTKQYLLPVHSETLSCQRGTSNCSHNVIDFRNYHKFEGESTIQYGDGK